MTTNLNPNVFDDEKFADELLPGTPLLHGQYVIEQYLNSGGFGITYLAKDSLHRRVVIKECFPSAFCRRSETIVGVRSRAHANEFRSIVKLFVQEARSLARLRHPNIVGVHQVFEDNDTAYMALDYIEGRDLLDIIEDANADLQPHHVEPMLREVLDAVKFIHAEGVLHRDISPDNILLNQDNRPVLIDFGAARETATKASRVLTAMRVVKDGYSPQEFYLSGSDHYPCSDLYALGASIYHLLTGETPPNSQERLAAVAANDPDPYEPVAGRVEGYDRPFLSAIDKSLNIFPKDRLQSATEWLEMISAPSAIGKSDEHIKLAVDNNKVEERIHELVKVDHAAAERAEAEKRAIEEAERKRALARVNTRPQPDRVEPRKIAVQEGTGMLRAPQSAAAGGNRGKIIAGLMGTAAVLAGIGFFAFSQGGGDTDVAVAPEVSEPDVTAPASSAPQSTIEFTERTPAPVPFVVPSPSAPAAPDPTQDVADTSGTQPGQPIAPTQDAAPVLPSVDLASGGAPDFDTPDAPAVPDGPEEALAQTPAVTLPAGESPVVLAERPAPRPPEKVRVEVEPVITEAFVPTPQIGDTPPSVALDVAELPGDVVVSGPTPDVPSADNGVARFLTTLEPTGDQIASLPQIDTVAPTPQPAPTPAAQAEINPVGVIEATNLMAAPKVELPFATNPGNPTQLMAVAVSAPDWLEAGQTLLSVNGIPVQSDGDALRVIQATTDLAAADVNVTFGLQAEDGDTLVRTLKLPTVYEVALLNGDRFISRPGADGWETTVLASNGNGDDELRTGDVVVAYMTTGEPIDGRDTFHRILDREINAGTTLFNFAVRRDGEMWVVSMPYDAALGN